MQDEDRIVGKELIESPLVTVEKFEADTGQNINLRSKKKNRRNIQSQSKDNAATLTHDIINLQNTAQPKVDNVIVVPKKMKDLEIESKMSNGNLLHNQEFLDQNYADSNFDIYSI